MCVTRSSVRRLLGTIHMAADDYKAARLEFNEALGAATAATRSLPPAPGRRWPYWTGTGATATAPASSSPRSPRTGAARRSWRSREHRVRAGLDGARRRRAQSAHAHLLDALRYRQETADRVAEADVRFELAQLAADQTSGRPHSSTPPAWSASGSTQATRLGQRECTSCWPVSRWRGQSRARARTCCSSAIRCHSGRSTVWGASSQAWLAVDELEQASWSAPAPCSRRRWSSGRSWAIAPSRPP